MIEKQTSILSITLKSSFLVTSENVLSWLIFIITRKTTNNEKKQIIKIIGPFMIRSFF